MMLVGIKGFIVLIKNKPLSNQFAKAKLEVYEKLVQMSRNDDYTTENLLHFSYHQNYYKLIIIDLLRQTNTNAPQQIFFAGKL